VTEPIHNVYILDCDQARVETAPGQAQIFGRVPDQAMRILDEPGPDGLLGITTTDIQNAIAKQNALWGAGQVGQQPVAKGRAVNLPRCNASPIRAASEYEDIILRANPDGSAIVRVKDVARAEVGPETVHRRQQAERNTGNSYYRLPAAGRERARRFQAGAQGDGGHEVNKCRTASSTS